MKKQNVFLLTVVLTVLGTLVFSAPGFSQTPTPPRVDGLKQAANGEVEITWNPRTDTPSFIRGHIPLAAVGLTSGVTPATATFTFIDRYADLFGVRQASQELKVVQTDVDALGMKHVTLGQVYQGVEVYDAYMKVHLSADGQEVVAISSGFVPDIQLADTQPGISADQALAVAQSALPNGVLVSGPRLVVYPGPDETPGTSAKLAWLVELRDDSIPARNVYVVDAIDRTMVDVLDRLYEQTGSRGAVVSQDKEPMLGASSPSSGSDSYWIATLLRETYDANHGYSLPGTLARSEGDGPTGDQDVDNAHDFAGDTYDYYWNTHHRDSYDDQGVTLVSTANYGYSYMNAGWNGEQVIYGDGFPVKDVVAHEWTHAVTEHSANFEYRWQSGALHESFSDIFGAMIDRDDWLMGEDLPPQVLGGREAIRDLSDPPRFGQPDHTDDWVETCSDNEGVHINNGITNKAYYNIATDVAIGKDRAERIFYRVLTVYLHPTSSLEDARSAVLQATWDLSDTLGYTAVYTTVYTAVQDGFNAVGLDGLWNPPSNDCICAATTALSDGNVDPDQFSALDVAATLYRVRDQLLGTTTAGQYYRTLYELYTGRISQLLLLDPALRTTGGQILREVTPGLNQLMDGHGNKSSVTRAMVIEAVSFLQRLAKQGLCSLFMA